MFLIRIKSFGYWNQAIRLIFFLIICMISLTPYTMASNLSATVTAKDSEIKVAVELKSLNVKDKSILPFQIFAEPAGAETIEADRNIPKWLYIPQELKAYKILARDSSGDLIGNDKISGVFTLGLEYPKNLRPGLERNLRLFVLNKDKWIPVKSKLDVSNRMVKTESANQFGVYRLLAPADIDPQKDVFVYPNPVQFGFGKTLKFENIPQDIEVVIEIYTIFGEQLRKIEVKPKENAIWDGKKDNDEFVTSGLYLYRVQMVGKEAFGKIVVMR